MIIPTHLQMARNSHIFLCSCFVYLVLNLHTKVVVLMVVVVVMKWNPDSERFLGLMWK